MPDHRPDDPRRSPDLDRWLPAPSLRLSYRHESAADAHALWRAAESVPLADTGLLGRMVRWRIPGTAPGLTFGRMFREPPFVALEEGDQLLVSGLVGRIWTLRRDYPSLRDAAEFESYHQRGTARVVFANWVEPAGDGRSAIVSEARVDPIGLQGRVGVAAIAPLVHRFGHLVGTDGLVAVARRAEGG
jgi:hypothetical protein